MKFALFFQFKPDLLHMPDFFLFSLFLLLCLIKTFFFLKEYGVLGLVFKIDVIDGKKWASFVAMQQNSATLIFDLNTMKEEWRIT